MLRAGLYEDLVTEAMELELVGHAAELVRRVPLVPEAAGYPLARYVGQLLGRALAARSGTDAESVRDQLNLANAVIELLRREVPAAFDGLEGLVDPGNTLLALMKPSSTPEPPMPPKRPEVPLSLSALLINGKGQPRIGTEIVRELASAEAVDLVCAFIKWAGFRLVERAISGVIARGGRVRVLTTTFLGSTDRRALDGLVAMGAEVKVSYDTRSTRLHAKAWLFSRATLTTAYVGSSNLSHTALHDGQEWNVRLSAREQPHLIDAFSAAFDNYWADISFETFDPVRDGERFDLAIAAERGGPADLPLEITSLDVTPYPYQRQVLDELAAERELHDRWHNLVVMATGTGKTIVSALDYRRLRQAGRVERLLFVAHREEILDQSRSTFRHVLRDGAFGEKFVRGARPTTWRHVFASVQSLANLDLSTLDPKHFSMVIVDEFHHAEAQTYDRLLRHLDPTVLLGLTATPERMDGGDVTRWFAGRIAVELRLWDALERGILCPFQYFGIADDTDLSAVTWRRGSYDTGELSDLYSANQARASKVVQAVQDHVAEPARMRALGFCVSVAHAHYMAEQFSKAGISSRAVSGLTEREERTAAVGLLRNGGLQAVFAVDLFNEGLDIPEVDTVLFLRPTESATLFLQQLGRGLRLSDGKPCLTVLDFIGNQHASFRFDRRYRALTGTTRQQLTQQLTDDFPYLPAGCHIELDTVAKDIVLENVRQALKPKWRDLAVELKTMWPCSLRDFLGETTLELEDLYRRKDGGWTSLLTAAGLREEVLGTSETSLIPGLRRMLHVDDPERLSFYRRLLDRGRPLSEVDERTKRLLTMLHFTVWGSGRDVATLEQGLSELLGSSRRQELREILDILDDRRTRITHIGLRMDDVPLSVHGSYSRDEALAAFGLTNPGTVREGVRYIPSERADVLFVTLNKSERHYSPTTMYRDRAISPDVFQWETQSTTPEHSPTAQRYINHQRMGTTVHLFIRATHENDLMQAEPYLYAGPVSYLSHIGSRPMEVRWKLERELPADVFLAASAVAG